jgi:hypothetical protein
VLAVVLHAPRAIFGWISLVAGVHFFGLARVWGLCLYGRLGTAIATCGAAGLVAAAAGAGVAVITAIAAIVPGVLLLAASFLSIGRYRAGRAGGARDRSGFQSRAGRVGR